jgi:NADH-quinone oxidoreductase subunit H
VTDALRDLFDNYWVLLPVKVLVILALVLTFFLVVAYMEHKVMAHMQARVGPMEAGRFHGVLQIVADGIKFVQKESIIPRAADRWVFSLAPAVALIPVLLLFGFIPYGRDLVPIRSDIGLFVTLALSSVGVIGVLMAAWSSANKYSLMGGVRAAAQLIAYELPLVLAAAAVAMQAGSADLAVIVERQGWWGYVVGPLAVGFFIYGTAALAELTRPPFDMPVADTEIIFGHLTEYTGLRFAFFLLAEYVGIVAQSAIAATLFLGGWKGPVLDGPWWLAAKVLALSFCVIWFRSTYPRLREDQLQSFAWLRLVPVSLLLLLVVGFLKVYEVGI